MTRLVDILGLVVLLDTERVWRILLRHYLAAHRLVRKRRVEVATLDLLLRVAKGLLVGRLVVLPLEDEVLVGLPSVAGRVSVARP